MPSPRDTYPLPGTETRKGPTWNPPFIPKADAWAAPGVGSEKNVPGGPSPAPRAPDVDPCGSGAPIRA